MHHKNQIYFSLSWPWTNTCPDPQLWVLPKWFDTLSIYALCWPAPRESHPSCLCPTKCGTVWSEPIQESYEQLLILQFRVLTTNPGKKMIHPTALPHGSHWIFSLAPLPLDRLFWGPGLSSIPARLLFHFRSQNHPSLDQKAER